MLNNLILVGRLADDPKVRTFEDGVKVCNFVLAVERPFQNQETGNYDVDFINVSVWRGFADANLLLDTIICSEKLAASAVANL